MISHDLSIETSQVLLRPMEENDFPHFHLLAQDTDAWQYFTLNLADEVQLKQWMNTAFSDRAANTRLPFTIISKATGKISGSMSMGNISFHDLRLEIGWSWLGSSYRGSGINFHSKYAMLRHAFDVWNFERVEFKTDVLNERAKQGLRKIGGQEEGVLRSHMTMWNNRRRDSVYFSILKNEWPQLKHSIFKELE